MFAVLDELLSDSKLSTQKGGSIEETRAKKLTYILKKIGKNHPKEVSFSWSENHQEKTLSEFPTITIVIDKKPRFLWKFQPGHFTLLPIDSSLNKNWLLNQAIGAKAIVDSQLPESIKGLLLPFYHGEDFYEDYRSEQGGELRSHLGKFSYELLFGSPLLGKEEVLRSLDHVLTIAPNHKDLKDFGISWIRDAFSVRDVATDKALVFFLHKYKDIFLQPSLTENFGPDIEGIYKKTASWLDRGDVAPAKLAEMFDIPFSDTAILNVLEIRKKKGVDLRLTHLAAEKGKLPVLKFLAKEVPALFTEPSLIKFDKMIQGNRTPLHYAAQQGNVNVVKFLVEKNTNLLKAPLAQDENGNTPLRPAIENNDIDLVVYFVEKNPDLLKEPLAKNKWGQTPLHEATGGSSSSLTIVEYLVQHNPDLLTFPLAQTSDRETPLHFASSMGHLAIVDYLITQNPNLLKDPLVRDTSGRTPLHEAVFREHLDVIRYLVKKEPNLLTMTDHAKKKPIDTNSITAEIKAYLLEQEKLLKS